MSDWYIPEPTSDRRPEDGETVILDPRAGHGMRVVEETPEEQAQRGIANLSGLVAIQQGDPSGGALYKAVQALSLDEAHALLYLAAVGLAGGWDG